MSFLNFLDRNALKIQTTFDRFTAEINSYEELGRKYPGKRCLSNPRDLVNHLNSLLAEFRTTKSKCFSEVTFKYGNNSYSFHQAEQFMITWINMIKKGYNLI